MRRLVPTKHLPSRPHLRSLLAPLPGHTNHRRTRRSRGVCHGRFLRPRIAAMPPAAPPIRLNALTCCLLALLACLRAPGAETTTEIGPRLARIAHSQLAIEFILATGRFRAIDHA